MSNFYRFTVASAFLVNACLSSSIGAGAIEMLPQLANPVVSMRHYRLLQKIALDGASGWDYLTIDSAARRLYLTRSTEVEVMDIDPRKIVGKIAGTSGVHGVALAPELGRGFTSNGKLATATIFDLKTLRVLGAVKTGANPDAIVYDPFSKRVFTFNGKTKDATVFDAKSAKVLGTIPLGGKPEFATTNDAGRVYVNIEDTSEVVAIDVTRLKVTQRSALKPCQEPTGITIDKSHNRLFIGCHNQKLAVVEANSGRVEATLPIGKGADATAFDSSTGLVFNSNGDGTLNIIRADAANKFRVVDNVATQRGARTMALDPKTHHVFLVSAEYQPQPAPVAGKEHPRPKITPGTVAVLVFGE